VVEVAVVRDTACETKSKLERKRSVAISFMMGGVVYFEISFEVWGTLE